MALREGRGSFIDGQFVAASGEHIVSADPARDFEPVFSTPAGNAHVDDAVSAAEKAQPAWAALSSADRVQALQALKQAFDEKAKEMATAIVYETGKPHREALGEARSLGARIDLMASDGLSRIAELRPVGGGYARPHAQGVLAVIGPYNYPAHLVNAHVIPALMTGNTVVVKPTEHCPWVAEIYASCMKDAGLPKGVFNLVHGKGDVGARLTAHPGVHGVLFTGSFATGQAILRSCLEQPWKVVALEMGGKNAAVILEDADLTQALAGVLQGAYLTAGQRCTATSRVLVERRVAERFLDALAEAARRLMPGDPWIDTTAFGPLANRQAFDRFLKLRASAQKAGADVVVPGEAPGGGAFVTPSVHRLPEGTTEAPGYLDEELFGPDLCVETVEDTEHAITRLNASPYGLANAVFTASDERFERIFVRTRSGILNRNKSTNGASGKLPFGGVGRSGNQRPAGVDAMRYTTFPVAVAEGEPGDAAVEPPFIDAFQAGEERFSIDLERLLVRQEIESTLERYNLLIDDVAGAEVHLSLDELRGWRREGERVTGDLLVAALGEGARLRGRHLILTAPPTKAGRPPLLDRLESLLATLARQNPARVLGLPKRDVVLPEGGRLPRSEAYLRRMYRGGFIPREKKTPVVDLGRSEGPILRSVDSPPLAILDAASQIASLGLGFGAGAFLGALDEGRLTPWVLANPDSTVDGHPELDAYGAWLKSHAWPGMQHVTWASGGSEANERAFDLCRLHGPGGRRIIAFEGSFHGRTLASISATWNPQKRAAFEFKGYEARFVPFPAWEDPRVEPDVERSWTEAWSRGEAPEVVQPGVMQKEVESLLAVKTAVQEGDVCCVVVEPMQGEGGDQFATSRFFHGLRALTRALKVPLVFDEVQTGMGLGGPILWHESFHIRDKDGRPDGPDCVTLAKKAQVGVCLSVWPDPRPPAAHVVQALRGHLHGRRIVKTKPDVVEATLRDKLWALALEHPGLVQNPRNRGWAFGFDLPSASVANQLVNQRFYRGFMAYLAGERTVRFRLNTSFGPAQIDRLFAGIKEALELMARGTEGKPSSEHPPLLEAFRAPTWVDPPKRKKGHHSHEREGKDRLDWLLSLPRGPLERVCDLALAHEQQHTDERVNAGLAALGERPLQGIRPSDVGQALRRVLGQTEKSADQEGAWERLTEKLGMPADRLLIEAIGARIMVIDRTDWARFKEEVVAIENATYEVGRRETEDELRAMVEGEGGLGLLALRYTDAGPRVVGYAFGGPVEAYKADGPRDDVMNGRENTFYSSNITVSPDARGAGLGARLKRAQLEAVRTLLTPDGGQRYGFLSSRNRVGRTAEMGAINRSFGAYEVERYVGGQYGDVSGEAAYLRIPFHRPRVPVAPLAAERPLDWASSVEMPLGPSPKGVLQLLERGELTGPIGTKLTLSNWATPAMVRYTELLREMAPRGLAHTYFTSGRGEVVDKGIRCLRVNRPQGQLMIGLERQFVGTATAAARSLTDPAGQEPPFGWFDWPRVPHPAEAEPDATLGAITAVMQKHGADAVLGIVVELVGEKSGYTLPAGFLDDLAAIRKDTGVPLVFVETASALGRAGPTLFMSDRLGVRPSMLWWYCGAQLGHVFVDESCWVSKPLTLISTWDGDELSALRNRVHLLEAKRLLTERSAGRLGEALDAAGLGDGRRRRFGEGLWQVFDLGDDGVAARVRQKAKERGLLLGRGLPGRLVVCPPLDVTDDELARGAAILQEALLQEALR